MARHVMSVEPFRDSILRIHKAAHLEGLTEKITLSTNAVSNKRNEVKKLAKSDDNIGSQSLLPSMNESFVKPEDSSSDKYLVETILLDDLVEYLPKPVNSRRQQAIMKMDIEGFEQYVLSNATNLFNVLDVNVIFMEWVCGKREENIKMNISSIEWSRS